MELGFRFFAAFVFFLCVVCCVLCVGVFWYSLAERGGCSRDRVQAAPSFFDVDFLFLSKEPCLLLVFWHTFRFRARSWPKLESRGAAFTAACLTDLLHTTQADDVNISSSTSRSENLILPLFVIHCSVFFLSLRSPSSARWRKNVVTALMACY